MVDPAGPMKSRRITPPGGGGGGAGSYLYSYRYGCAASGGGGGGGSSYVEPSAKNFRQWQGWKNATGDGLIVLSW